MALQPTMDAPKFKGTAVVNGQFKEISLEDYKGRMLLVDIQIVKNNYIDIHMNDY